MLFVRKLPLLVAALAAFSTIESAEAASCGTDEPITIAEMTWLSAGMLAHVTKTILSDGYGCKATLVPGDTVPTTSSMLSKSKPDIAPELWVSANESIWAKMLAKGNVFKASNTFSDGAEEGWWVPDYVAAANPTLKSIFDLKKHAGLFTERTSGDKARLYGCPPGWACEIVTQNLFRALNLEKSNYELFSPGSGANLKAAIARKVARKKPVLAYYWGPTAVIAKYKLVRLDMPAYDAKKFQCLSDMKCDAPEVSGWKPAEVAVAAVSTLKVRAPEPVAFLQKMSVPSKSVHAVLAWADANSASSEEAAEYFFRTEQAVWTQWLPPAVVARVKSARP